MNENDFPTDYELTECERAYLAEQAERKARQD